jgi:hypothetical protein
LNRVSARDEGYVHRALDFVSSVADKEYEPANTFDSWAFDVLENHELLGAARFAKLQKELPITGDKFREGEQKLLHRLLRRCKGLLKAVAHDNRSEDEASDDKVSDEEVSEVPPCWTIRLVHRTLLEFIGKEKHDWAKHLAAFDWLKPYCFSLLMLTSEEIDLNVSDLDHIWERLNLVVYRVSRAPDWFIEFLSELDNGINRRCNSKQGGPCRCPKLRSSPAQAGSPPEMQPEYGSDRCAEYGHFSVDLIVASLGLHEYLSDLFRKDRDIWEDKYRRTFTVRCVLSAIVRPEDSDLRPEDSDLRPEESELHCTRLLETLRAALLSPSPLVDFPQSFTVLNVFVDGRIAKHHLWQDTGSDDIRGPLWMKVLSLLFFGTETSRIAAILNLVLGDLAYDIDCKCYLVASTPFNYDGKYITPYWFEWGRLASALQLACVENDDRDFMTFLPKASHIQTPKGVRRVLAVQDLPNWKQLRLNDAAQSRILGQLKENLERHYDPVGVFCLDPNSRYDCEMLQLRAGVLSGPSSWIDSIRGEDLLMAAT